MIKRSIKAILLVLLFVVLLSPVKVSATQPSYMWPLGIVVEIDSCNPDHVNNVKYIVDVVVLKEELTEFNEQPNNYPIYPDNLINSEYSNIDNEWISVLQFAHYHEWDNGHCDSIMFGYGDTLEWMEITQYKIVIYESGKDPVESKVYFTTNLATWDDPSGFKHIYDPNTQTFSLQGYEAELIGGYNPGFFNSLLFMLVAFIGVIVFLFGLMESLIYLISRQGKHAVLIPLLFNLLALGYAFLQTSDILWEYQTIAIIGGILFIPSLYAGKILLLHRYSYMTYKISILFSVIFYTIYFFLSVMILR